MKSGFMPIKGRKQTHDQYLFIPASRRGSMRGFDAAA